MAINIKKLDELTIQDNSFKENAKWQAANQSWLKKSAHIAMKVILELKKQELSQKGLAEKMQISSQQVSKLLRGQENLTLETISKLELALGIDLIKVNETVDPLKERTPVFKSIKEWEQKTFSNLDYLEKATKMKYFWSDVAKLSSNVNYLTGRCNQVPKILSFKKLGETSRISLGNYQMQILVSRATEAPSNYLSEPSLEYAKNG